MATLKVIHCTGKYQDDDAMTNVIHYITQPSKTPSKLIGTYGADMDDLAGSMIAVAESFDKNSHTRLRHFVLSFRPGELDSTDTAYYICVNIAYLIGQEYQVVFAFHEDTDHPHIHFVVNSISYVDGHRYRGTHEDYKNLIRCVASVLDQFNLGPVIPVKYKPNSIDEHE